MIYDSDFIINKLNSYSQENQHLFTEEELSTLISSDMNNKEPTGDGILTTEDILEAFSELRLKLAEHMRLDNVLFVLGNGASLYAGSKNTNDFDIDDYKSNYGEISSVIEEIKGLRGIENQLNALITVRDYYHIISDGEKEKLVDSLIDDIKSVLICNYVNSIDYRLLSSHEILLLKLRAFGCLNRTSIFSTNYDLAFEYTLDKIGIEYNNGFSGFVNRTFDPRVLQKKDKTSLIKVHGSVNWVVEDDQIKEFQPKFTDGHVLIDNTSPVLIYPTSGKLYQTYSTPYSELMRNMLNVMEEGQNVIFVLGYKYGDEHINEVLFKALKNPNNVFYFFQYNPKDNPVFISQVIKLSEIMPNINILTGSIMADYGVFVKYILPATPEKSEQEKAIDILKRVLV